MEKIRLGRTGLMVTRSAFGALPIQRVGLETARAILRRAYEAGINLFDSARGYSDSEEKLGYALADVRDEIHIATKSSGAKDGADLLARLEISLTNLRTDHVDILQLHNPRQLPDPDDPESLYAGLMAARQQGKCRFIGITNHRLDVALQAARSGLYDTVQFPLSALSADKDLELPEVCARHDIGLIAMKALSGGLLDNAAVAFAGLRRFDNVVPIWGIQRLEELDEFLALEADPPALDAAMLAEIARYRQELSGNFCRGCGYCLPCPAEIPINTAARITFLMRRSPSARFLTPEFQEQMRRINDCQACGHCTDNCPYELDTPALLKRQLAGYEEMLAQAVA